MPDFKEVIGYSVVLIAAIMVFDGIPKDRGMIPMYFPGEDRALAGIREIAEKGNPKDAEHTLKNVDWFRQWEDTFPLTLTTIALNHSSLRWFGTHAFTLIARGLPSSLVQHEPISVLLGTLGRSGIANAS